ncbi:OmpA family protein [Algivirga pacifica]|uniref:OmpA family protein n=2 Tax=Algivirga pacifica TaxID=1162670 RepID=A0ABP9DAC6_9BACT
MIMRENTDAKKYFNEAITLEPSYGDALYALGQLYYFERNIPAMKKTYAQLLECCGQSPEFSSVNIIMGRLAIGEGNYDQAQIYAQQYMDQGEDAPKRSLASQILSTVEYAKEQLQHPLDYTPQSLPNEVNIKQQQYFPVITADQKYLYFTARDEQGDENIYQCVRTASGWSTPESIESLNTPYNEGTCSISADGKTMIFTFCENTRRRFSYGSCDLFISYNEGGEWSEPVNMGPAVNSPDWDSQPSLSADGRTLYFVSDRRGGQGQSDIWVCKQDDQGKWMPAKNLGMPVNTSQDDISPFIHANGTTLFFASKGHLGMGDHDLFQAELQNGVFSEPKNLGYPINTFSEQVSLFITADGKQAYYSMEEYNPNTYANRRNLASFTLPEEVQINPSGYIKGKVLDKNNQAPVEARITLMDIISGDTISLFKSDKQTGDYLSVLPKGKQYAMHVSAENYVFHSMSFDYRKSNTEGLTQDIYLSPITTGTKITLNNLFFEINSFKLLDASKVELGKLADFLQKNKTIRIAINGHTDNVGSSVYNLQLSQKRAESVVTYLKKLGITDDRLHAKGFGEKQPIAPNDTTANKALNRRIEFEIL